MKKVTILGLPETGKTTFIAALWHVLESVEIFSDLILEKYEGDKQYLNDIREKWLGFEVVNRTTTSEVKVNSILIKNQLSSEIFELLIPDLSGEIYTHQLNDRILSEEFNIIVDDCNYYLLFINPSNTFGSDEIDDVDDVLLSIDKPQIGYNNNQLNDSTMATYWNPENASTQVKLVDIVQMILYKKKTNIKLGVIISAWDLVDNKVISNQVTISPADWLKSNLPLLSQYLSSNAEIIDSFIVGISAQGGDYSSKMDNLTKLTPSERIKMVIENNISNDITKCISQLFDSAK